MKKYSLHLLTVIFLIAGIASCKKEPSQEDISLTKNYTSDVANEWFSLLASTTRTNRYPSAPSIRILAFSSIAMYETVVTGMPSYQSIYKYFTNNTIDVDPQKDYYWPAAANAALARISEKLIKNFAANADLTPLQQLEARFNTSFQTEVNPDQLQFSIDFGKYVADKIYDWSTSDGTLNPNGTLALCPAYIPLGTPGTWVPTPTGFFPAAGACQGSIRTFIPNIVNSTLPPPPIPYSTDPSSDFYKMANEVYQTSLLLTPDEIKLAQSWRDFTPNFNNPSHVLMLSSQVMAKEKLNLEDAAVLYAKLNISMSDAIASVFKAKFNYALLRPITYIRGVMGYTTWNSVTPTPQHPAYPSTTAVNTAGVSILEKFFGNNYAVVDSTQQGWIGTWSYSSLDEFAKTAAKTKILAGHNYRFAVEAGITQGRMVADMVNLLPFKKP
ncbi:MAG TPA: vanadium-dependent haloperoxidase [Chitinophagaceae bacterium]|nr:vanadium-dependent haloperoxidase [Chitinophagaceae bacterium]